MRIFTLGRNGIPLFFFAFFLFSGTSSYGQTCPTVDEPQQTFCDTEQPTVADLVPNGPDVQWYADETSTTPLSGDTSLADGEDYFAGSASDDTCARVSVEVTIYGAPRILGQTRKQATKQSSSNYIVCLQNGAPPIYLADIETDVDVVWYANDLTRDAGSEVPLDPDTTELVNGEEYYAARNPSDVGGCATTRSVLTVNQQMRPTAKAEQWFCAADEPVIGDIVASGTNRYYASETDLYQLDASEPLEDGRTYYVSQVEYCESEDRTAVTVTVAEPVFIDQPTQQFCTAIADGEDFTAPTVGLLQPADGIWYADETFSTELEPETELIDGEVYYFRQDNCEFLRVEVELIETPNAGADSEATFCSNEESVNLVDFIDDSVLGAPHETGSFDPALENNILNPADFEPGEHEFIYTVEATYDSDGDELCPADQSIITVTINETPDAGEDLDVQLCFSDFSEEEAFLNEAAAVLDGIDTANLAPSLEELYATISQEEDPTGAYNTTYTLTNSETGCIDTAEITLNIGISPDAGTAGAVELCASDAAVDLMDYIEGTPDAGGTFTPALSNGSIFDPAVDEPGTYTYTVESSNGICEAAETTVEVTLTPLADAGEDDVFLFCETDEPQSLYTLIEANGVTTEGEFTLDGQPLTDGVFDPAAYGPGEVAVVYTVQPIDNCGEEDTATYNLVVSETPDAPVATSASITACASEFLTVGDIGMESESENQRLWYYDEALTQPADEADLLETGDYYATQINEASCESEATVVTVTINDAATPTIAEGGAVFCSYDRPTIASLEENMSDTGITWYDAPRGGNELSTTTQLQNGTAYYASLTDAASGCESSQRLEVTAVLENCPLPIQDAFSPNGDGINDTFDIEFAEQEYPNYSIEIFNRWGKKVFTGNASTLWDGTSDTGSVGDNDLPAGVYFYIFYFNDGQSEPVQGRVYLSR